MNNLYEDGLEKCAANYAPLTPLSFIARSATVFPDHVAIIHGSKRRTWAQTYERCRRLASALAARGIGRGDGVAVMAPNIPEIYEAHFGVPMSGAVLNAINTRLDAKTVAYILDHGEAKVVLTDTEYSAVMAEALTLSKTRPLVIDIADDQGPGGERLGEMDYEAFLAAGDPGFDWQPPDDEWRAISLNYTSGTTGEPKGVVYHHRGASLTAVSNIMAWGMTQHPIYLWTLPMFHCNGWCFPWAMAAVAGTNICLRRVEAGAIYDAFADLGVTHLCGAPIVMQMILDASDDQRRPLTQKIEMMTAAAPPPPSVLARIAAQGIHVTHVYGLTETYGPAVVSAWKTQWDVLPEKERAAKLARQGVAYPLLDGLMVAAADSLAPVAADGRELGEVLMRGNLVMKGYLKNKTATEAAFAGGWFHSGDLAVRHADSYVELKDRSKDIIISGGENISSIEVEGALYRHPDVSRVAVVAKADEKWGETPCAFVELRPGAAVSKDDLIAHCRQELAQFKCPRHVVFGTLPATSTGKIQKFILRERADNLPEGAD